MPTPLNIEPDDSSRCSLGGAAAALLGGLDDLFDLRARWQLLGQVALALLAVALGIGITSSTTRSATASSGSAEPFSVGFTIFWIVGMINSINWIDGLDGLSTGVALIAVGDARADQPHDPGEPAARSPSCASRWPGRWPGSCAGTSTRPRSSAGRAACSSWATRWPCCRSSGRPRWRSRCSSSACRSSTRSGSSSGGWSSGGRRSRRTARTSTTGCWTWACRTARPCSLIYGICAAAGRARAAPVRSLTQLYAFLGVFIVSGLILFAADAGRRSTAPTSWRPRRTRRPEPLTAGGARGGRCSRVAARRARLVIIAVAPGCRRRHAPVPSDRADDWSSSSPRRVLVSATTVGALVGRHRRADAAGDTPRSAEASWRARRSMTSAGRGRRRPSSIGPRRSAPAAARLRRAVGRRPWTAAAHRRGALRRQRDPREPSPAVVRRRSRGGHRLCRRAGAVAPAHPRGSIREPRAPIVVADGAPSTRPERAASATPTRSGARPTPAPTDATPTATPATHAAPPAGRHRSTTPTRRRRLRRPRRSRPTRRRPPDRATEPSPRRPSPTARSLRHGPGSPPVTRGGRCEARSCYTAAALTGQP